MSRSQAGSALILSVFVAALLASLGIALLFLGQLNLEMNKVSANSKRAFYLAESGIENGRRTLYDANGGAEDFGPRLQIAAGDDLTIDFDADDLVVQYDDDGNIVAITGYEDDAPLMDTTLLGDGVYAAFLTNDPIDGRTNLSDTNARVMITGVGVGPNKALKVVEALVEPEDILPPMPPAVLTMMGSEPIFDGGSSNAERYSGEDCHFLGGGQPDLYLPVVGTTSDGAESSTEDGIYGRPDKYTSGGYTGDETAVDLTDPDDPMIQDTELGTIDPVWMDCAFLQDLLKKLREHATYYCDGSVGCEEPETTTMDDIFFVDGDIQLGPGYIGSGVLVVTGELEFLGTSTWTGIVLVIGEGSLMRRGGGNGILSGTSFVANIPFGVSNYEVVGGGNADVDYCSRFIPDGPRTYHVVGFRQL
jgi:hypothetical protein